MSARPTLHLTFDDGPDEDWTPAVLAELAMAGATATFFVLTDAVKRVPHLIEHIQRGGHRIGLHGERHLDHSLVSANELAVDTRRALTTLRALGVRPTLWRLPWGREGAATAALAAEHGLCVVGWDHDTHDWRGDGWAAQPGCVRQSATEGGVVLLHDGIGPGATRRNCRNTVMLVSQLLQEAARHGTPVRALSEAARA